MIDRDEWLQKLEWMPNEGPGIRGDEYLDSGIKTWAEYDLIPTGPILDLGCGHGRMAIPLTDAPDEYLGIDILEPMIDWCNKAFENYTNINFKCFPVKNGMYQSSRSQAHRVYAEHVDFGLLEGSFLTVIALSLFTHLESTAAVENYLRQIRNALAPGGTFISTWFLSPPNTVARTAARAVYSKNFIYDAFSEAGFSIKEDWGGTSGDWHDQTRIVAT